MYDESITVGTLITTYHKGYHILTRLEFNGFSDNAPVFHYQKVLNEDGTESNDIDNHCHASYCHRVLITEVQSKIEKDIQALHRKREAISKFV